MRCIMTQHLRLWSRLYNNYHGVFLASLDYYNIKRSPYKVGPFHVLTFSSTACRYCVCYWRRRSWPYISHDHRCHVTSMLLVHQGFYSLPPSVSPHQQFPLSLDVLVFSFSSHDLDILLVFSRISPLSSFFVRCSWNFFISFLLYPRYSKHSTKTILMLLLHSILQVV